MIPECVGSIVRAKWLSGNPNLGKLSGIALRLLLPSIITPPASQPLERGGRVR